MPQTSAGGDACAMSGHERVLAALNFKEPDRVPRWFNFWPEFRQAWERQKGAQPDDAILEYYGTDMMVVVANETAWPLCAGLVEKSGQEAIHRSGWGVVARTRHGAKFSESIETAVPRRVDPHSLRFDDPLLDVRYQKAGEKAAAYRHKLAVFCKTGGPYLRAAFMRGQEDFLMDMVEDPAWVKAFVERVTDHIMAVGMESIRRFRLQDTGIGIYDDVCSVSGPVMGPKVYEKLFYPSLCKMVEGYKKAGAAKVFHHCDGYTRDLLEMWVEAGIDAHHPLEARTGLDPVEIREQFGDRLAIIGGVDNVLILPRGDRSEVRAHVMHILQAARGGGLVFAPHSIGPDVSVETMDYVLELLEEHGRYPLQ